MHVEVSVGLNFVISYLYNKLPRRRVDFFAEELEKEIKRKFDGHWYPEKPFKGSAFRCIKASGDKIDPVMELAAVSCALDITEIQEYLPKDLTIWIDPNEVSYRIGEKGVVKILYSDRKETEEHLGDLCVDNEIQTANKSFNPDAQSFRPIETLSTSLNNLSLSPAEGSSPTSPWGSPSPTQGIQQSSTGSSPINSYLNRGNSNQSYMTAASFAATKFGSTKLKSHAKRPTRLSPTDFGSYIKQRSILQNHWISGVGAVSPIGGGAINPINGIPSPHGYTPVSTQMPLQTHQPQHQQHASSLSPRDPRQEILERQRLLLLQQQLHQQQQQQQKFQQISQLQNNNILGSFGGSLNEIHQFQQQQSHPKISPNIQQQQQQQQQHFNNMSSMFSGFNNSSNLFGSNNINGGVPNESSNLLHVKCPPSDLGSHSLQSGLASNNAPSIFDNGVSSNGVNGASGTNNTTGNQNDSANWNSLPPYAHLQHLLVAN